MTLHKLGDRERRVKKGEHERQTQRKGKGTLHLRATQD